MATKKYFSEIDAKTTPVDADIYLIADSEDLSGANPIHKKITHANLKSSLIIDEDTLASNLDTKAPTQQSVKAYVDTGLATKAASSHTHTASEITDFDTEVANNSAVTANTAKISYTDAAKMATIETNADVTDTANVTAAGALMDSEVTNLAQVKAFDSSDYATAAQGALADSALQSGDIGTSVQAYDADTTKNDVANVFTAAQQFTTLEIGHATDTTLSRASAGVLAVEGVNLATVTDVTNKTESFVIAVSDETTDLTTGTAKVTFRMPYAFTVTAVRASVTTAPTGSVATFDINEGGVSILSTKLTIDATEKTSTTAATAAAISDSLLADDAEITIDIDTVGSTIAGAGAKIYIIGHQ